MAACCSDVASLVLKSEGASKRNDSDSATDAAPPLDTPTCAARLVRRAVFRNHRPPAPVPSSSCSGISTMPARALTRLAMLVSVGSVIAKVSQRLPSSEPRSAFCCSSDDDDEELSVARSSRPWRRRRRLRLRLTPSSALVSSSASSSSLLARDSVVAARICLAASGFLESMASVALAWLMLASCATVSCFGRTRAVPLAMPAAPNESSTRVKQPME